MCATAGVPNGGRHGIDGRRSGVFGPEFDRRRRWGSDPATPTAVDMYFHDGWTRVDDGLDDTPELGPGAEWEFDVACPGDRPGTPTSASRSTSGDPPGRAVALVGCVPASTGRIAYRPTRATLRRRRSRVKSDGTSAALTLQSLYRQSVIRVSLFKIVDEAIN